MKKLISLFIVFATLSGVTLGKTVYVNANYGKLPAGYTECEYLESTRTQYIDTGIVATNNVDFLCRVRATTTTSLLAPYGDSARQVLTVSTGYRLYWDNVFVYAECTTTNWNTIEQYWTTNYCNGIRLDDTIVQPGYSASPVCLFAIRRDTGFIWRNIIAQMSSFSMWTNGIPVRNLIPALDPNSVPCMFDTVTQTPLYNAGTGDFLYSVKALDGTSWSSPYTNLQTAVTAAVAGDLVLVTNGVYSPISTGNKAITIQSVEGSAVTSIDGRGTTRCATLGTGVVLKGFTVFNGYTTGNGGGSSGGTLTDCVISGNKANVNGGGSSGGTLTGCVISNNVTTLNDAGGSYQGTLTGCTISGNTANGNGGGSGGGTLTDCVISGNTANGNGGGSYYGTLTGCTISGNTAAYGGGSHNSALTDCVISGNTANVNGGGAYGGTLTGCVISGNTANNFGGGSSGSTVYDSDIIGNISSKTSYAGGGTYGGTLYRCGIYNNGAPNGFGGGANRSILYDCVITNNTAIRGSAFADAGRTYNCIMSYNIATQGGVTYQGTHDNSTIVNNQCGIYTTWNGTYRNSIIWGNSTTDHYAAFDVYEYSNADTLISGVGNISVDPLFVDSSAGDFRLQPNSPCINKGANQYVTTATDLPGSPRIKDWRVDMGAYEAQSTRFVVTPNALFPMGTKDVYRWTPIPAVAWYKLDGNALDSSGNGYDGTWNGTEAYATGKYGQGGSFNGSSGISTVGQTIIPAGPVTIVAWAKLDRHINYQAIAGAGILASRVSGIGLTGNAAQWAAQNRAGMALELASTNHASTADWTHLAAVRNGIVLRLYVNGVLSAVTASAKAAAADVRFAIGQRYDAVVESGYPLDGSVDDVRVYARDLSQANIVRIMESQDKAPLEELQ